MRPFLRRSLWSAPLIALGLQLSTAQLFSQSPAAKTTTTGAVPATEPKRIVVYDDLRYRTGDSKAWTLDLAMPENFGDDRHPVLVIVHGGGWRAGTKRDRPFRAMLTEFALKGYVTMSVEYRLTGEAPFPACIEDCKCAIRWLRACRPVPRRHEPRRRLRPLGRRPSCPDARHVPQGSRPRRRRRLG